MVRMCRNGKGRLRAELMAALHRSNLGGKPVRVLVENVYLLATPTDSSKSTPEEDAARAQAAKLEKLENAEMLSTQPAPGMSAEEEQKNQSFTTSLVNKIVDNLQIEVSPPSLAGMSSTVTRRADLRSCPGPKYPYSIRRQPLRAWPPFLGRLDPRRLLCRVDRRRMEADLHHQAGRRRAQARDSRLARGLLRHRLEIARRLQPRRGHHQIHRAHRAQEPHPVASVCPQARFGRRSPRHEQEDRRAHAENGRRAPVQGTRVRPRRRPVPRRALDGRPLPLLHPPARVPQFPSAGRRDRSEPEPSAVEVCHQRDQDGSAREAPSVELGVL